MKTAFHQSAQPEFLGVSADKILGKGDLLFDGLVLGEATFGALRTGTKGHCWLTLGEELGQDCWLGFLPK